MGFFVMVLLGLLGILLLITGVIQAKKNKSWAAPVLVGVLCIAVSVWLAWPK